MSKVIVFATPVFLLLIALEYVWSITRGRRSYRLADALTSIQLGVLSEVTGVVTRLIGITAYALVYRHLSLVESEAARSFWTSPLGWLLALVAYDFCYYWLHRAGHVVGVFWAAHVVHHQSQDYNLSTALRQTSTGPLLGWLFYLPLALAGMPPLVLGIVSLVDLLYQFWVHTEQIGRLGWFDRWFCSPSNHRVHHAVNDGYLDKNYGGILMLWDHLFGTFADEREPCVYGTRSALNSWDPLWANLEVYRALASDSWHTRRWSDKLRVWFKPPGWRPADVAQRFPRPAFDLAQVQCFDPPMSRSQRWAALWHFVALLGATSLFLWDASVRSLPHNLVWLAALSAVLWGVGAAMQGRIGWVQALMIDAAALAAASSVLGPTWLFFLTKPAVMALGLMLVWQRSRQPKQERSAAGLLLAALVGSLAGDVFLMLPGNYFVPGLVSFLLAHLCYIALFRLGVPWFPSRLALALTVLLGAVMYAVLWDSLPSALLLPVAVYVSAISLTVAQALGRAQVLGDPGARAVALGACLFMCSDTILALNKFVSPLPMASFWVLLTYFAAQILMASHALRRQP